MRPQPHTDLVGELRRLRAEVADLRRRVERRPSAEWPEWSDEPMRTLWLAVGSLPNNDGGSWTRTFRLHEDTRIVRLSLGGALSTDAVVHVAVSLDPPPGEGSGRTWSRNVGPGVSWTDTDWLLPGDFTGRAGWTIQITVMIQAGSMSDAGVSVTVRRAEGPPAIPQQ